MTRRDFADLDDDTVWDLAHHAKWTLRARAEALTIEHPAWCARGADDRVNYDAVSTHPQDWSHFHASKPVDNWIPVEGTSQLAVVVEGTRHPNRADDWPDHVTAHETSPGSLGGIDLEVEDARRLGRALLAAADLADTDPAGSPREGRGGAASAAYTWAELDQAQAQGRVTQAHVEAGLILLRQEFQQTQRRLDGLGAEVADLVARVEACEQWRDG